MIGILSDAHGNSVAFGLGLSYLKAMGVKRYIYLGDSVGYIPSTKVVEELQSLGGAVQPILGNHEIMLFEKACDPKKDEIYQLTQAKALLTQAQMQFIRTWPTHFRETYGGCTVLYVHGGPNDFTNEYVYPDSDFTKFNICEDIVFMGHSHYPFIRKAGETTFVNVGSCGLPRDDGRYASMATFDPITAEVNVYRYDISESVNQLLSEPIFIHDSVRKLFDRRAEHTFGQILVRKGKI